MLLLDPGRTWQVKVRLLREPGLLGWVRPRFAPGGSGEEGKGSFASLCMDLLLRSHFLSVLSKIIRKKKMKNNLNITTKPTFYSSWYFLFS